MNGFLPIEPGCLALLLPSEMAWAEHEDRDPLTVGAYSVTVLGKYANGILGPDNLSKMLCSSCERYDAWWEVTNVVGADVKHLAACECHLVRIDGEPENVETEQEVAA